MIQMKVTCREGHGCLLLLSQEQQPIRFMDTEDDIYMVALTA